MPMTPPMTPEVYAQGGDQAHTVETTDEPESFYCGFTERVVLLYVGRM